MAVVNCLIFHFITVWWMWSWAEILMLASKNWYKLWLQFLMNMRYLPRLNNMFLFCGEPTLAIIYNNQFHRICQKMSSLTPVTLDWRHMSVTVSQISGNLTVQQLVHTDNKVNSKTSHWSTFVRRIHWWFPLKGPVMLKVSPSHKGPYICSENIWHHAVIQNDFYS